MEEDTPAGHAQDSGGAIRRKILPGRLRRSERKLLLDKLIKEDGRYNGRLRRKIRERLER